MVSLDNGPRLSALTVGAHATAMTEWERKYTQTGQTKTGE